MALRVCTTTAIDRMPSSLSAAQRLRMENGSEYGIQGVDTPRPSLPPSAQYIGTEALETFQREKDVYDTQCTLRTSNILNAFLLMRARHGRMSPARSTTPGGWDGVAMAGRWSMRARAWFLAFLRRRRSGPTRHS
ncbi:hypothetical protein EXIGLDRAFT_768267 [Exidia glandulosa HHB12029]|uniref:Uncharacterized protein n=1 Tax=Exidia glandulosa HHB12029 TaxID=1314781 RepID=A0A165IDK0_EXIGL|nr:hypothetical protein EXIGLDRAFT_768267 [Exidia glandulosa HHB12029]